MSDKCRRRGGRAGGVKRMAKGSKPVKLEWPLFLHSLRGWVRGNREGWEVKEVRGGGEGLEGMA